jgi:hypothetical protein
LGATAHVPAEVLASTATSTVDLSPFDVLQRVCACVRNAGLVTDEDATTIRSSLQGAVLHCAGGRTITVLFLADEGIIMCKTGPTRCRSWDPGRRG